MHSDTILKFYVRVESGGPSECWIPLITYKVNIHNRTVTNSSGRIGHLEQMERMPRRGGSTDGLQMRKLNAADSPPY